MKKIIFLIVLVDLFFVGSTLAQKVVLDVSSEQIEQNFVFDKVSYARQHANMKGIKEEVLSISSQLKRLGYFLNRYTISRTSDTLVKAKFLLGSKVDKAILAIPKVLSKYVSTRQKEVSIVDLPGFLEKITSRLELEGKTFSKIQLKKIELFRGILRAELEVAITSNRLIDSVAVKGYRDFSKSHIHHYLKLRKGDVFSKQKVRIASENIKSLSFVEEIRPAEVLFSRDTTIVYLYLKEKKTNSFNGLLSFFTDKKTGEIKLNGDLSLKLQNSFDMGETFSFRWIANAQQQQNLSLAVRLPYLFGSPLITSTSFDIHRQDTLFVNRRLNVSVDYAISQRTTLGLTFDDKVSKKSGFLSDSSFENFDTSFLGLKCVYGKKSFNPLVGSGFFAVLNPSIGYRKSLGEKNVQYKLDAEFSYLFSMDDRNKVFVKNKTTYLYSLGGYLINELERIGGANSLRGFEENGVFTPKYSYINLEYRYATALNSYLYLHNDFGLVEINDKNEKLYTFGLGYAFVVKNTLVNIGYTFNKSPNRSLYNNAHKTFLSVKSFF